MSRAQRNPLIWNDNPHHRRWFPCGRHRNILTSRRSVEIRPPSA